MPFRFFFILLVLVSLMSKDEVGGKMRIISIILHWVMITHPCQHSQMSICSTSIPSSAVFSSFLLTLVLRVPRLPCSVSSLAVRNNSTDQISGLQLISQSDPM